jgi:hypothetical protein
LTVLAAVAPLVDLVSTHSLEGHVRDAYPGWGQGRVNEDLTAIVVFLVSTGVLGIVCWLGTGIGMILLLPCLAGLVAVVQLWTKRSPQRR